VFTLTGSDLEGDPLTFAAQIAPGTPNNGVTVSVSGNQVTVTPPPNNPTFNGGVRIMVGVGDATHPAFTSGDTQIIDVAFGGHAITGQAPGTAIKVQEGTALTNGQVATFTTTDTAATASNFTASISWGDGNVSDGTVTAGANNTFVVTSTNTYLHPGRYLVRVTISHATQGNRAIVYSTATVTGSPFTTVVLPQHSAELFNQANLTNAIVAVFKDPNFLNARASDFTATVDWGDGSPATTGTISKDLQNGQFNVTASHQYAKAGLYTPTTTITKSVPADDAAVVGVPGQVSMFALSVNGPQPTNESYVAMLYQQLLGRTGDPIGMSLLSHLLNRGAFTRADALNFIINSEEYRTIQVNDLYQEILNRAPDKSGMEASLQFLRQGGRIESLRQFLLQSDEFFQTQGNSTMTGFVNALYQRELGRSIDASGQATFKTAVDAGISRSLLAQVVVTSEEFYRKRTGDLFQTLLGHPLPTPSAADEYFNAFHAGVSDDAITGVIGTSEEFFTTLLKKKAST
jgi:hypothetical protein